MQNPTQLTIVKANKVIEASYRLTLAEQRVLLVCIAQVDAMVALTEDFRFEVTASEIVELSGLKQSSDAYLDLQKASEKLYERSVILDGIIGNNWGQSNIFLTPIICKLMR